MKNKLTIAAVQSPLIWEEPAANRRNFKDKIAAINREVDVVLLPEMFSTGFSMNPVPLAETMQGETLRWMKQMAHKINAVMAGSIIIEESGHYYNRFLWVTADGQIEHYNKRHLFTLAGEGNAYKAGKKVKIVKYQGWQICLNVCYDLRFPVWSRNVEGYHVLMFVANWPQTRVQAWSTLLRARAIENQCYVVGLNRIGQDANQLKYTGQSAIIDMEGNYLAEANDKDDILYSTLDKRKLIEFREKFPFYRDQDQFTLIDLAPSSKSTHKPE